MGRRARASTRIGRAVTTTVNAASVAKGAMRGTVSKSRVSCVARVTPLKAPAKMPMRVMPI
jgi:hypothetical protein